MFVGRSQFSVNPIHVVVPRSGIVRVLFVDDVYDVGLVHPPGVAQECLVAVA